MAGYSKNPLWKKLGIKEKYLCLLFQEPENYFDLLEKIPDNSNFTNDIDQQPFDLIHVFIKDSEKLILLFSEWKNALKKDGSLWISWPKGTSKIETNLSGNDVRRIGLEIGLVDVKVCAVDNDWSGLKFMYRKEDR